MGADARPVTDPEWSQDLCTRTDDDAVADRRMPLRASRQRSTAERYALIERDIVTHLGGFADHHAHAVVDEYPLSDACPRVNFNAGQHPAEMRNEPAGKQPTALP